ncbi:hypothetical protein CPL00221_CDS0063 [Escherichia phage RobRod40]
MRIRFPADANGIQLVISFTRKHENGSARIKINLYGSPSIFHSLTHHFISIFATIKNIIASEAILLYVQ